MKRFLPLFSFMAVLAAAATIGDSRVADAAMRDDREAVRALLKQHAGVNLPQADGSTALLWAAHSADVEMTDILLRAGAAPNIANTYGVTPLSEATLSGDPVLIEKLLKAGADPNAALPEGETVLMSAARTGNDQVVKLLLDHGADVNAKEKWLGQTALMWAVAENHSSVVDLLIGHGADINARSQVRDEKMQNKWFVANVVSPPPHGGFTPLLFAARQGSLGAARVLVEKGADLNAVDPENYNALVIAIVNAHYDVAAFLLDHGANPNIADKYGRAALYAAVDMHTLEKSATRPDPKETDKTTSLDVIKSALAHGADPNAKLLAATPGRGSLDVPDMLLRAGATPFLRAAKFADLPVMRLLLEHGADPKLATQDHTTALLAASGLGWKMGISRVPEKDAIEAIQMCLDHGADINAANDSGSTALHGAAARGGDDMVPFLVAHGAKLEEKDKQGRTPLDIATGKGGRAGSEHESTAALIQKLLTDKQQAQP